jgi:hypothetical protein
VTRSLLLAIETPFSILALATLALVGCGSDDASGSGGKGAGGASGGAGGAGGSSGGTGGGLGSAGAGGSSGSAGSGGGALCAPSSGPAEIAGQWGVQASLKVRIQGNPSSIVRICPDPQVQPATLFLKLEVAGTGTSLTQSVRICDMALPIVTGGVGSCPSDPAQYIETRITPSPGLAQYLPTVLLANLGVSVSAPEAGAAYNPAPFALVLGATLANPATEPLPRWDASRSGCGVLDTGAQPAQCVVDFQKVTDDDSDTQVGVTVGVEAVDAQGGRPLDGDGYTTLRVAPELSGTINNSSCITGALTAALEFSIVDSDISLSGIPISTASVIEQLPPLEILAESTFKMLRADGEGDHHFDDDGDGTVSCAEIKNHVAAFSK